MPAPHRFGETGDAEPRPGPQLERIAPLGVDATEDHIHAFVRCVLGEARRLHPHPAVADHEILALHEREPEDVRDEGLIVRRLGVRARRQDHDAGIGCVRGSRLQKCRAQGREVRLHAVQAGLFVQLGQHAREHAAVLHRVAEARGRLNAVGEHPPLAGGVPPEIGAREDQRMRVEAASPHDGSRVPRVTEDDRRRDHSLRQQALLTVDVREERVQQLGPLGEPDLQPRPGRGIQDEGHRIELPGLRPGLRVAVGGTVVGEERRDLAVDPAQFGRRQIDRDRRHSLPGGPQGAIRPDHLVEAAAVSGQGKGRLRDRSSVVAEQAHPGSLMRSEPAGGRACAGSRAWTRGAPIRAAARCRGGRRCGRSGRIGRLVVPPPRSS